MREKVEAVLNSIRPVIRAGGGELELVGVSADGVVRVRLGNNKPGCPMSHMTLKNGIERQLTKQVPEVVAVVAV